jgi:biopolymer transport protein ExbD
MSHGSTEKCEPNFTPLLDLVLQLVMFFMLCTNFVMDQASDQVKLPEAVAAKALDKTQDEVIYLNINSQGKLLLPPSEVKEGDPGTLDNAIQVEGYMKRRAEIEMAKTKKKAPEATIILRIDKETPFGASYPIIKACRTAGYTKVELRAIRYSGQEN